MNPLNLVVPEDLRLEPDVRFDQNTARPLRLHLLSPKTESQKPRPVLIYIFGGAFRMNNKDAGIAALIPFAQQGYLCATIEYRYSSEAQFPAQLEDCKCAVRFLRAHAAIYNLDPERIGVWGESSGGYLTTMLAVTANKPEFEGSGGWHDHSSHVNAACDFFGPSDFLAMNRAGSIQDHDAPDSPESELIGGAIQAHPELVARANPITHVSTAQPIPPFLIVHGDADPLVPFNQSELLYAALEKANAPVKFFKRLSGAGHGGAAFKTEEIQDLVRLFFAINLRVHP
jgi:acetyl esterase/lipase